MSIRYIMATEAIRVGQKEAEVIKAISERMDISKEEALILIFEKALKNLF